jgi:hypothetical protein
MGMEILILKKAVKYASLKMLMEISGKDPLGFTNLSCSKGLKKLKDSTF